jgi:hypothetical protein
MTALTLLGISANKNIRQHLGSPKGDCLYLFKILFQLLLGDQKPPLNPSLTPYQECRTRSMCGNSPVEKRDKPRCFGKRY